MFPYLSDESPIIKKLIAADKGKKKTEALLSLSRIILFLYRMSIQKIG